MTRCHLPYAGTRDVLVCALLCALALVAAPPIASGSGVGAEQLQSVVDDLRTRLAIPHVVEVAVVDAHPLLVAVERQVDRDDTFLLQIEGSFLATLTPIEVRAAIAHELGHVWIFTHHPYLQTEPLANRIALRVVTRGSLAHLYEKMWLRQGVQGDLAALFGS